ncbi:hypothetical protein ABIA35_002307 [Catenulispora sp. MAP12-49]|uniref:lipase family protein n=1 Tax=Catenulispora sp. MAP12-49 TaxID=3156302 RepID=UPI00351518E4
MAATQQLDKATAMVLAAAASTGATTRPSGETQQQQCERIAAGIKLQLDANAPGWEAAWLLMTPTNANLAYIAVDSASNQVAVVLRGTNANVTDTMEDLAVGTTVPFPASGATTTVSVSSGAMAAFTELVNTEAAAVGGFAGGAMEQALVATLSSLPENATVFVIGHSLGGCIATMVTPYLVTQCTQNKWPKPPSFGILTFAAPTAGLKDFADYFTDTLIGKSVLVQCEFFVNVYDIVPQAWATLGNVLSDPNNPGSDNKNPPWYPKGTQVVGELADIVKIIETLPGNNTYYQPGPNNQQTLNLNPLYGLWDEKLTANTLEDFMGQIAFQHDNATYLALLGSPLKLLTPPTVDGLIPTSIQATTGTVEIAGTGFKGFDPATNLGVDFGTYACPASTITVVNDTRITITGMPPVCGVVDVRVTTPLGTSAASPLSKFAVGGPEPVWVSSISPTTAAIGETISVYGHGFAEGAAVFFGPHPSPSVKLGFTDPEGPYLTVEVPGEVLKQRLDGKTFNVTVAVNGYSSPSSPADEFTYPAKN